MNQKLKDLETKEKYQKKFNTFDKNIPLLLDDFNGISNEESNKSFCDNSLDRIKKIKPLNKFKSNGRRRNYKPSSNSNYNRKGYLDYYFNKNRKNSVDNQYSNSLSDIDNTNMEEDDDIYNDYNDGKYNDDNYESKDDDLLNDSFNV